MPYIYRLAYPTVAITDSFISRTVRDSRWNRIESIVRVHENFNPTTRSRPRIDRITEITRATYNYFSRINREIGSATNLFRKIYARSRHTFPPNSEPSFSKPSFQRVLSFSSNGYELTARENIESLPSWKRLLYMNERKGEEKGRKETNAKISVSIRVTNRKFIFLCSIF